MKLRNDVVHVQSRNLDALLQTNMASDITTLKGKVRVTQPASLQSLLTDAACAAMGGPPPSPLVVVDERVATLLG